MSVSDTGSSYYTSISDTPAQPAIPYDTPRAYGHHRAGDTGSGGIADLIREHPIPFVMVAAGAGILFAAWMRSRSQGPARYRSPDPDVLIGAGRSGKSASDSASVLLGPDGQPLRRESQAGGQTTVGWALDNGRTSHSDTVSGQAADMLGQTNRDNPPPGQSSASQRTEPTPVIFDRP